MPDDPTYTDLARLRHNGAEWRREGMCNQCGVLVLDQAIHTADHQNRQAAPLPGDSLYTSRLQFPWEGQ